MVGWGNDDWGFIFMFVYCMEEEKMVICIKYIEYFGGDFIVDIRLNCRGDYEDVFVVCIFLKVCMFVCGI